MRLLPPWLRSWWAWPLAGLLGGCAQLQALPDPTPLLHDATFAPSREDTTAARVLALSEAMRQYADTELRALIAQRDARRVLVDALQQRGQLQLDYDAERTGNAAETFDARRGNCLSLVLMTGAFARHLGLQVSYRRVHLQPQYSRSAGLTIESGHVNLLMAQTRDRPFMGANDLIVDFMPGPETAGRPADLLDEATVLAMYMNNRAAETLAQGRLDDAYAWARAALRQDPRHGPAANTLAVVYLRRGAQDAAEAALRYALDRDAQSTAALGNLVALLRAQGRDDEAAGPAARLKLLQPVPPFAHFERGRQALAAGDAAAAQRLFDQELRRQPFQHEVHFWAAQAALALGDARAAREHLRQAMDYSPTIASQKLYAAKLDRLLALSPREPARPRGPIMAP